MSMCAVQDKEIVQTSLMKFGLFPWLEMRFVNLTFSEDEIECDVDEIKKLLEDDSL